MEWRVLKKEWPTAFGVYDVTLQDFTGGRLLNVAIFRPEGNSWELLIDAHNYKNCPVIAWQERPEVYRG